MFENCKIIEKFEKRKCDFCKVVKFNILSFQAHFFEETKVYVVKRNRIEETRKEKTF